MQVKIEIFTHDNEEAKAIFGKLGELGYSLPTPTISAPEPVKETPAPEKPATRRKSAPAAPAVEPPKEAVVVPMNTDPLGAPTTTTDPLNTAAPTTTADPLNTPAPVTSADPLNTSAPVANADPLGTTAAPDPLKTAAAPVTAGPVTLQMIREKIGEMTHKKQQAKDLIATFKKADGTPCEKPSDIQESDYEAVYNDLDYL